MKNHISNNLIKLANVFADNQCRLYVVGGWVRNNLCGLPLSDIDICGNAHGEDFENMCGQCGFEFKSVNAKLGTYLVLVGDEKYEYTPFRIENYHLGKHTPEHVEWTEDIRIDARRRDFTCNAIYYDILADRIIDFYDGQKDIEKGILRAVETPEFVFSSDGLRILRLVRFACQLGWKIDRHTFRVAKKMTYQLKYISGERKTTELKSIFTAEKKYGRESQPLKILNDLCIYPYLVPIAGIKKHIDEKVYEGISRCDDVMGAFVCALVLSKYTRLATDEQYIYDVQSVLSCLRCGGDVKDLTKTVSIMGHLKYDKIDLDTVCKFISLKGESRQIVREIFGLEKLLEQERYYIQNNIPLRIDDLDIDNSEILKLVPKERVSYVKKYLFDLCQNGFVENKRKNLVDFIKRTSDYANRPKQKPILKGLNDK